MDRSETEKGAYPFRLASHTLIDIPIKLLTREYPYKLAIRIAYLWIQSNKILSKKATTL
jgi:hypothetical protein